MTGYKTMNEAARWAKLPTTDPRGWRAGAPVEVGGCWYVPIWYGVTGSDPWGTEAVLRGRGGSNLAEGVAAVRRLCGV
jgi:hypothetical protein